MDCIDISRACLDGPWLDGCGCQLLVLALIVCHLWCTQRGVGDAYDVVSCPEGKPSLPGVQVGEGIPYIPSYSEACIDVVSCRPEQIRFSEKFEI